MRVTKRGWRVAIVTGAMLGFASGATGIGVPGAEAAWKDPKTTWGILHAYLYQGIPGCWAIEVGQEDDRTWRMSQRLQKRGWYGVAGDGAERLYHPNCAKP